VYVVLDTPTRMSVYTYLKVLHVHAICYLGFIESVTLCIIIVFYS